MPTYESKNPRIENLFQAKSKKFIKNPIPKEIMETSEKSLSINGVERTPFE